MTERRPRTLVEEAQRREVRRNWLLCTPALAVVVLAASGPLLVVLFYPFLTAGDYGGVKWEFSTDGWFNVLLTRDIFDDTLGVADAHMTIFWRSLRLSIRTTLLTLVLVFRPPTSSPPGRARRATCGCF